MKPIKGIVAGGVALALGTTAGCASGSSHASKSNPAFHAVQAAYTKSMDAKTAKVTFTESVNAKSKSGSSQSTTITGSGAVDFTSKAFKMSVNAPSGGSVQLLETRGIEYVQVPPADVAKVPGHKPWVSVNLNKVGQARLGKSFSQLAAGNDDPADALSQLAQVSSQVTKKGTSSVNGVSTTEYVANVDLNKVAAKASASAGPKAGAAVTQEEKALGTQALPVQVWIDSKHLVRKMSFQVAIPPAQSGATNGSGTAAMTMTFADYGAPVQVNAPPSSQVADITSLLTRQPNSTPSATSS